MTQMHRKSHGSPAVNRITRIPTRGVAPQMSAALVPVCGILALTNRDESQASEAKSGRSLCASESRTDAEAEELLNEALVAILRKNAERRGRTDAQQEKEAVGGAWAAQCKGVHLRSVWLRSEAAVGPYCVRVLGQSLSFWCAA